MNLPFMKKLVSAWLLLSSVGMLSVALTVSGASETPSSPSSGPGTGGGSSERPDRPALRGDRALGPFSVFDTDHDGTLSAGEIADASGSLRKLDQNGDGKLTANELRPSRPPRDRNGNGEGGGRGEGDLPPARRDN